MRHLRLCRHAAALPRVASHEPFARRREAVHVRHLRQTLHLEERAAGAHDPTHCARGPQAARVRRLRQSVSVKNGYALLLTSNSVMSGSATRCARRRLGMRRRPNTSRAWAAFGTQSDWRLSSWAKRLSRRRVMRRNCGDDLRCTRSAVKRTWSDVFCCSSCAQRWWARNSKLLAVDAVVSPVAGSCMRCTIAACSRMVASKAALRRACKWLRRSARWRA